MSRVSSRAAVDGVLCALHVAPDGAPCGASRRSRRRSLRASRRPRRRCTPDWGVVVVPGCEGWGVGCWASACDTGSTVGCPHAWRHSKRALLPQAFAQAGTRLSRQAANPAQGCSWKQRGSIGAAVGLARRGGGPNVGQIWGNGHGHRHFHPFGRRMAAAGHRRRGRGIDRADGGRVRAAVRQPGSSLLSLRLAISMA